MAWPIPIIGRQIIDLMYSFDQFLCERIDGEATSAPQFDGDPVFALIIPHGLLILLLSE